MENIKTHEFFDLAHDFCEFVSIEDRRKLEEFYGSYLPLEIWVALSLKDTYIGTKGLDSIMFTLSIDEIISAGELYEIDFVRKQLVPLFDCMDGRFLVYDLSKQIYLRYAVVTQTTSRKYKSLNDFVQANYKEIMEAEADEYE